MIYKRVVPLDSLLLQCHLVLSFAFLFSRKMLDSSYRARIKKN